MGQSTDGEISFGIKFEEDQEFPWDAEPFEGNIDEWWRSVNGFKDVHQPWTEEGEYAEGWNAEDPRFEDYYAHRRQWDKANPLPIELVNYCSWEAHMYILAVPGSVTTASRGYPVEIPPLDMEYDRASFRKFFEKYLPGLYENPKWWLSSYWG